MRFGHIQAVLVTLLLSTTSMKMIRRVTSFAGLLRQITMIWLLVFTKWKTLIHKIGLLTIFGNS